MKGLPGFDKGIPKRISGFVDATEHPYGQAEPGTLVRSHQRIVRSGVSRFGHSDHFALDLRLQRSFAPCPAVVRRPVKIPSCGVHDNAVFDDAPTAPMLTYRSAREARQRIDESDDLLLRVVIMG